MPDHDSPSSPDGGKCAAPPNDGSDAGNRHVGRVAPAGGSVTQKDSKVGLKKVRKVDFSAVFAQVMVETKDLDKEAIEAKFPWMKNNPPRGVGPDVAARVLEEIYEELAREADKETEDDAPKRASQAQP
ncbi:hypothetical protein QBC33DRAFT_520599 [Phialemonium atrogriseum]|uniref:Uncharacterized protein n=1 Tax=Phialemonium atrogriseum TaxID=1093897 RepID=A0AAJ0FLI5_9PEZI|nr:uncharacterized protein QBC33DRAFT_520599 [Phialemonium atrogriseum]KAK1772227.1 hypothetical protein QBC33DRAFT_520599 [Phialemonium atrogriseum]